MRWNVLFDELEYRFDDITRTENALAATPQESFSDVLRETLLEAKRLRSGHQLVLRPGREVTLTPRTVGRDFVAGSFSSSGVDAVIALRAVIGIQSKNARIQSKHSSVTFAQAVELWCRRRQQCVVTVFGAERRGVVRAVSQDTLTFQGCEVADTTEYVWKLSAIDMIRTLTAAEEEQIRG